MDFLGLLNLFKPKPPNQPNENGFYTRNSPSANPILKLLGFQDEEYSTKPFELENPLPISARVAPGIPQAGGFDDVIAAQKPIPTPTQQPNPTNYEDLTLETFNNYGIPPQVAYALAAGENGPRNRFNIGAHDGNPQNAPVWDDLTSATKSAKMLSGTANSEFYGAGEKGKQAFANAYALREDPEEMLAGIRDAGFAGDPATWKARSIAQNGAGKNFDTWDEFIMNTPAWRRWRQ